MQSHPLASRNLFLISGPLTGGVFLGEATLKSSPCDFVLLTGAEEMIHACRSISEKWQVNIFKEIVRKLLRPQAWPHFKQINYSQGERR